MRHSCFALPLSLLAVLLTGAVIALETTEVRGGGVDLGTEPWSRATDTSGENQFESSKENEEDVEAIAGENWSDHGQNQSRFDESAFSGEGEPLSANGSNRGTDATQSFDEVEREEEELAQEPAFAPWELPAAAQEVATSSWNRVPATLELSTETAERDSGYQGCDLGCGEQEFGCGETDGHLSYAERENSSASEAPDADDETSALDEGQYTYRGNDGDMETDDRSGYIDSEHEEMYGYSYAGSTAQEAGETSDADEEAGEMSDADEQFGDSSDADEESAGQDQDNDEQRYDSEAGYQASYRYEDESQEQWDEDSDRQAEDGQEDFQPDDDLQPDDLQPDDGQPGDENEAAASDADDTGVVEYPTAEWSLLNGVKSWTVGSLSGLDGAFCRIVQRLSVAGWLAATAAANSQRAATYHSSTPDGFEF